MFMSQQCFCFSPVLVAKPSGVDSSFTVQDILNIVKIHISQAEHTLGTPFNCYLGGRWRPLSAEETLDSLNVQDLSYLYVQYVLPGGTVQIIVSTCIVQNIQQQENPTNSNPTKKSFKFKPVSLWMVLLLYADFRPRH
ncbi:hypothetical protein F5146DRAFT_1004847 [Armillaria mellea]|nr:hypothetical protein F5146DRAFT_1004847 [Armillaria mellea]